MMTHIFHANRPALAAIAAVIALATSPASAQTEAATDPSVTQADPGPASVALPPPAPDAIATPDPGANLSPISPPPPQVVAPQSPVIAPPSEVVQTLPPSPAPTEAVPVAASETARSPSANVTSRTAAPAAAPATASPAIATVAPVAPPDAAPVAAVAATAPVASERVSSAQPAATTQPDILWWALGGAGLALAGGLSLFAIGRRKDQPEAARVDQTVVAARVRPNPVRATPATEPFVKLTPPEPVVVLTPPDAPSVEQIAPLSPAQTLEAMVAASPSAENPFLTRKNRLRRAKYIVAHGAPEPFRAEARFKSEPTLVVGSQFEPQPAYKFTKAPSPQRFGWKPATT
jgi:hypothetical protein